MGKFSGVLLCSDFDGTLAYKTIVPPSAIEAIRYFQDHGGRFTLATVATAVHTKSTVTFLQSLHSTLSLLQASMH